MSYTMSYMMKCSQCGVVGEIDHEVSQFECPQCHGIMYPLEGNGAGSNVSSRPIKVARAVNTGFPNIPPPQPKPQPPPAPEPPKPAPAMGRTASVSAMGRTASRPGGIKFKKPGSASGTGSGKKKLIINRPGSAHTSKKNTPPVAPPVAVPIAVPVAARPVRVAPAAPASPVPPSVPPLEDFPSAESAVLSAETANLAAEAAEIENMKREAEEALRKEREALEFQEKARLEAEAEARRARRKAEAERLQKERAELERLRREREELKRRRAEAERLKKEQEELERLRREREELERRRAEAERLKKEQEELERLRREREELERRKAEEERLKKEQEELERLRRERDRLAAEEKTRREAEEKAFHEAEQKAQREFDEKIRLEREKIARQKAELQTGETAAASLPPVPGKKAEASPGKSTAEIALGKIRAELATLQAGQKTEKKEDAPEKTSDTASSPSAKSDEKKTGTVRLTACPIFAYAKSDEKKNGKSTSAAPNGNGTLLKKASELQKGNGQKPGAAKRPLPQPGTAPRKKTSALGASPARPGAPAGRMLDEAAYQEMLKRKKMKINLIFTVGGIVITVFLIVLIVCLKKFVFSPASSRPVNSVRKTKVETRVIGSGGEHRKYTPVVKKSPFDTDYDKLNQVVSKPLSNESAEKALEEIDNKITLLQDFLDKWQEEGTQEKNQKKYQRIQKFLERQYKLRDMYNE